MTTELNISSARERRALRRARARVAELQVLYVHLFVYLAVQGTLIALDLVADGSIEWSYWSALGWGIGLVIHAAVTLRIVPLLSGGWRRRKVAELMARELDRDERGRRR